MPLKVDGMPDDASATVGLLRAQCSQQFVLGSSFLKVRKIEVTIPDHCAIYVGLELHAEQVQHPVNSRLS